jgi:hypothetical protein
MPLAIAAGAETKAHNAANITLQMIDIPPSAKLLDEIAYFGRSEKNGNEMDQPNAGSPEGLCSVANLLGSLRLMLQAGQRLQLLTHDNAQVDVTC